MNFYIMLKKQDPATYGVTPEMIETAMNASFDALLDETFAERARGVSGEVVKGVITKIEGDYASVDVGMKSEGLVPLREFGSETDLSTGDEVEVFIEALDGRNDTVQLSREKARREEVLDGLEKSFNDTAHVKGVIFGRVKGGFTVDLQGVLAFLPSSQVDVRPIKDVTPLMNIDLDFVILKMDRLRGNLIVSRRAIMDESRSEARDEVLADMKEGKILEGVVKNITDYGAFIDLGGIDGLLHITDIAWHRINHPSEVLNLGEVIKVQVIRFNEETGRVSLGLKQMSDDPWMSVADKYTIGSKVKGIVTNITEYGAFIELDSGVEGLIHVSEMSWTRKNVHPGKILSTSQEVEVMVLEIDAGKRRISLGYKQCKENPWDDYASSHPVDEVVEGTIRSITDFGIFIGLSEDLDGLIHMSDISWDKAGEAALADYKKGDTITAKILSVDPEKERISLGIKQLTDDPYKDMGKNVSKDAKVTGKITAVNDAGITVELEDGLEGFIKRADLARDKAKQDVNNFHEGDDVTAMVIRVNKRDRKATLSIKALEVAEEKEAVANYGGGDAGAATLGDALGDALKNAKK